MNIHNRIKRLQNEINWSINHMALEADLSPGTVSNWFKRKSTPTIKVLKRYVMLLGLL